MNKFSALLLGVAACLCVGQAFARVRITNSTPYELKVLVHYDAGSEGFPKGAFQKNGEPTAKPGMMPGKAYTRKKDVAEIKRRWDVWAKFGETWTKVLSRKWSRGGAFVHAKIFMAVDPKTGENRFDIEVGGN